MMPTLSNRSKAATRLLPVSLMALRCLVATKPATPIMAKFLLFVWLIDHTFISCVQIYLKNIILFTGKDDNYKNIQTIQHPFNSPLRTHVHLYKCTTLL